MNSGIDMVERAMFLLRSRPAGAWAIQAAGAIPLLLSVLYFAFDTLSDPADKSRAMLEALACAACFLWFNACRARFAQLLSGALSGDDLSANQQDGWKQALDPRNMALQSCRLFAMPLALVAVVPFAWAVSFFRTGVVFAGRGALRNASKLAGTWPRQTWLALGALVLFSVVVFLNLFLVLAVLPSLVKIFSGLENDYTRLNFTLNSTVFMTALGLTWLLLDPLYQAVFCVRAFLAESRETGLDLMYSLRNLALLAAFAIALAPHAGAQQAPIVTHDPGISARELDASVEKVLEQREYAWRLPRHHDDSKPGFLENIFAPVRRGFRAVVRWIGEFLGRLFRSDQSTSSDKPSPYPAVRWSFIVLIAVLAVAVSFAIVRLTRRRDRGGDMGHGQIPRAIQLDDDRVSAADLPEEQWIAMASEFLAAGDYRRALRAFYLANLSWLGRRDLLTIAPFKSNRDYRRELRRRAPSEPLQEAFSDNISAFERTWYGVHAADAEQVNEFERTFQRMKGYVEA
jgi:Domain of unknown function (DUF4129)